MCIRDSNGTLHIGATRGDGSQGENVTQNIKTISNIPHEIKDSDVPDILEIRGEIYMKKSDFFELNERMQKEGKQTYVDPRNRASGSLRHLDVNVTKSRKLNFFDYTCCEITSNSAASHYDMMGIFKKERYLQAFCNKESGSNLTQNNLKNVSVNASATRNDEGYIYLVYEFLNIDECISEYKESSTDNI